ncbi:MAG: MoaD/ThiS family protein [Synechococcaceae cyanobacterium]|nr:MoaD/ThiS family protein [Synechococcaceae cyanobacterium]
MVAPPAPASTPPAPPPLRVRVLLFAGLREKAGWGEQALQAPAGATPRSLWRELVGAGALPAGDGALPGELRVAINQAFASPDTPLADGDDLAFLPPISGG